MRSALTTDNLTICMLSKNDSALLYICLMQLPVRTDGKW